MTHQTMCPTHRPRIFAKANEPLASAGRSWYRIEAKAGEDGKPSSVEVAPDDRRFNVGGYQENKL